MALRAVLFDLDGTLVDTLDDITIVLGRALAARGHPRPERAEVAHMIGDGARVLVARALDRPSEDAEVGLVTVEYVAAYEADPTPATKANPGAMELLEALAAKSIPALVVTNKPAAIARAVVERAFGARIRATFGAGDTARMKPHPDPIFAALESIDVAPSDAWMIGDGPQDIEAALAAGVRAIGFRNGYGEHALGGADRIIGDFRELLPL